MLFQSSLRLRLLVLILVPLSLISLIAMGWRYSEARETAQEIFDRNLMITVFAVARDVALSDGDTLAPATQALFKDASGGQVFYHVYGPDGSFVTGYSSPPVTDLPPPTQNDPLQLYDARHQGAPVRVTRLHEQISVEGISGNAIVTVWQRLDQRDAFVREMSLRAGSVVLLLLGSVAGLVLFGIGLGLKPLTELEDAIQKRSSSDLSPILRVVPNETRGIVARLNSLFGKVTDAQEAQQRFIALAAHQLRNPVAAIHTMAEATLNASTIEKSHERARVLVGETRAVMRLTNQLLSFERITGNPPEFKPIDITDIVQSVALHFAPMAIDAHVMFEVEMPDARIHVQGDAVLLKEAVSNLVDNAMAHGGPDLTRISLELQSSTDGASIRVENDGAHIAPDRTAEIFERFTQGAESQGAGLGLSICKSVAELHQGRLELVSNHPVRFELHLPALT